MNLPLRVKQKMRKVDRRSPKWLAQELCSIIEESFRLEPGEAAPMWPKLDMEQSETDLEFDFIFSINRSFHPTARAQTIVQKRLIKFLQETPLLPASVKSVWVWKSPQKGAIFNGGLRAAKKRRRAKK